jgi:hypothetical protein
MEWRINDDDDDDDDDEDVPTNLHVNNLRLFLLYAVVYSG